MDPQTQNTSLQRLQNVERVRFFQKISNFLPRDPIMDLFDVNMYAFMAQRVVRVLELAGGVMEELASPSGPKKEFVNSHCGEFMQSMKVALLSLFFTSKFGISPLSAQGL